MSNSGWEGILDKGEKVLWQGRPDGALHFKIKHLATFGFGLVFAGFALFWMVMASQAGGFMWMFGLIHFSVGVSMSIGPPFWNTYKRRNTWYTLTDNRAFIAVDMPLKGRTLKSYPIHESTRIEYVQGPLSTINFGEETRRGQKGRTYQVKIGFEYIPDGAEVYRLIRDLQKAGA